MTFKWTASISPQKWRSVRQELEDNRLSIPYSRGVAHNRHTGYTLNSEYDSSTSNLVIRVIYPGPVDEFEQPSLKLFLDTFFDTPGTLQAT